MSSRNIKERIKKGSQLLTGKKVNDRKQTRIEIKKRVYEVV